MLVLLLKGGRDEVKSNGWDKYSQSSWHNSTGCRKEKAEKTTWQEEKALEKSILQ